MNRGREKEPGNFAVRQLDLKESEKKRDLTSAGEEILSAITQTQVEFGEKELKSRATRMVAAEGGCVVLGMAEFFYINTNRDHSGCGLSDT